MENSNAVAAPAKQSFKMSPAMIDAAVIQLRSLFDTSDDVPEKVKSTGSDFVNALDEWSEQMKKEGKS